MNTDSSSLPSDCRVLVACHQGCTVKQGAPSSSDFEASRWDLQRGLVFFHGILTSCISIFTEGRTQRS